MLELLAADPRVAELGPRSRARPGEVHVADSLSGLELVGSPDGGSPTSAPAPGFPGLVLAAALPETRVDLIESVGPQVRVHRAARSPPPGSTNARVVCDRAEDWASSPPPAGRPRGLRGGHRARRRPAGDARRARLAAAASTAACWSPGRAAAIRTRRPSSSGRADAGRRWPPSRIECGAGPYAGSRQSPPAPARKVGPTPAGLPRRPGHGEEAAARCAER